MTWLAETTDPGLPLNELHKFLWGLFPPQPRGAPRPFLFRQQKTEITLLCAIPPLIPHRPLPPIELRAYAFDAVLKPMNTSNRKPHLIKGVSARREWIARNLAGARITYIHQSEMEPLRFEASGGRSIFAPRMRAAGALVVEDAEAFTAFLAQGGPGSAKVYGCGMWWLPELMQPAASP